MEPVGKQEIAARLGVEPRTVHQWLARGLLPPPDFESINGLRAWLWPTVLAWAGNTGRLRTDALRAEYRAAFGVEPHAPHFHGPLAGSESARLRAANAASTRRAAAAAAKKSRAPRSKKAAKKAP